MSDRDALAYSTSSAQKSSPQRATRRNSVNDALLASPGKRGGRHEQKTPPTDFARRPHALQLRARAPRPPACTAPPGIATRVHARRAAEGTRDRARSRHKTHTHSGRHVSRHGVWLSARLCHVSRQGVWLSARRHVSRHGVWLSARLCHVSRQGARRERDDVHLQQLELHYRGWHPRGTLRLQPDGAGTALATIVLACPLRDPATLNSARTITRLPRVRLTPRVCATCAPRVRQGYLLGAIMLGANMTLCLVTFLMLTWTARALHSGI